MSVLSLKNVKRSFHQADKTIEVLKGIDLEVQPGELVALIGSSGSGKSTLLQVAGLLDSKFSGDLTIAGNQVTNMSDDARSAMRNSELGFIYQFHHLLSDFTAVENVALAQQVGGMSKAKALEGAEAILVRLGLKERLDHIPAKLSGGEQQRVAIARAMVGKPSLLLADEPTGNLDEETAAGVLELFLETVRERKLAAVIATHDRTLAAKLDRQLVLHDGYLQPA